MSRQFDLHFMSVALEASKQATCNRLHVGSALVKDFSLKSTGCNTSLPDEPTCEEMGCLINDQGRCIRTIHAELDAILLVDREVCEGATLYVTHEPCEHCLKHINRSGIKRVVYLHHYENKYNHHFVGDIVVEKLETDLWTTK